MTNSNRKECCEKCRGTCDYRPAGSGAGYSPPPCKCHKGEKELTDGKMKEAVHALKNGIPDFSHLGIPPKEEKCIRCGLPQNEWKGRWQEPLCKVGGTTHDSHILEVSPQTESWEEEFMRIHYEPEHQEGGVCWCGTSFKKEVDGKVHIYHKEQRDILKSFFSQELKAERQRTIEEVREAVEKELRNHDYYNSKKGIGAMSSMAQTTEIIGYHKGLFFIRSLLSPNK